MYLAIDGEKILEVKVFNRQIDITKNENIYSVTINFPIELYSAETYKKLTKYLEKEETIYDFSIVDEEMDKTYINFITHGIRILQYCYIEGIGLSFFLTLVENDDLRNLNGYRKEG